MTDMSFWNGATATAASLVDLLRQRAIQQPDQRAYTFLVDGETDESHLTYGELDRQARAIAVRLRQLGAAGERALLLYQPGLEYIAGFFGCLYAGVVAVPAYPPNPARLDRTLPRLQAIVANARARFALTTDSILQLATMVFEYAPDLGALTWVASDGIEPESAEQWQLPAVARDTLAFLQYTSGSTGTPKGVMLTQGNLLDNLAVIHEAFGLGPGDIGASWLPPYHDMGLIGGILEAIYTGVPCVLMSPMVFLQRPFRWLQAISRYGVTVSGGPNFAYELCAKKITPEQLASLDLSRWSVAFNGAEPVRHGVLELFAATFAPCGFRAEAFYPCYGLAEATLLVTGGTRLVAPARCAVQTQALAGHSVVPAGAGDTGATTLVSCGRIRAGHTLAIVDPATHIRCAPDVVGEIWVAGPSVAQGYWERAAESVEAFQAHTADGDEGPFLRTGDLGFVHEGGLYVTGRLKDLIIIDGRNQYPQDIEMTVEQSHPALRPGCSAAFAVDVDGQERLVVVAEVDRSYQTAVRNPAGNSGQGGQKEIIAAMRKAVAEAHDLRLHAAALLKTGSIPKTSSGKIQRHACKAGYLEGTLEQLTD